MKKHLIIYLLLINPYILWAQKADSITQAIEKITPKQLILPVALMTTGLLLNTDNVKVPIQNAIRETTGLQFKTRIDDYTQFVPMIQIYTGTIMGISSKMSITQKTSNIFFANLLAQSISFAGKHSFKNLRPDSSAYTSFPSGHTTFAFTNATLLFHEYKHQNIAYALSGYLFAMGTGFLRIANNRHWISDVVAGAGIGILSGSIAHYWNPLHTFLDKKKGKNNMVLLPFYQHQQAVGIVLNITL